jgi:hypothetical protein
MHFEAAIPEMVLELLHYRGSPHQSIGVNKGYSLPYIRRERVDIQVRRLHTSIQDSHLLVEIRLIC